jgi:TonB family protein
MILVHRTLARPTPSAAPSPEPPLHGPEVFLPPAEVLRQLRPAPVTRPTPPPPPPRAAAIPVQVPTPPPTPPPQLKDRISIGRAERAQTTGPIELRRGDDLSAVQKGRPDAAGTGLEGTGAGGSGATAADRSPGQAPSAAPPGAGLARPSLAETLRNLDQRIAAGAARGITSGTVQELGSLRFDPQGADFTRWVAHLTNEIYRNWIVPQSVMLGFHGRVEIRFTVERDGRISELVVTQSSGVPALDRAAANSLLGSRLWPLPSDYAPSSLTITGTFTYNEKPEGS